MYMSDRMDMRVLEEAKKRFFGIPGVTGVSSYDNVIVVYVESEDVARSIPFTFMGYSVEIRISGKFKVI